MASYLNGLNIRTSFAHTLTVVDDFNVINSEDFNDEALDQESYALAKWIMNQLPKAFVEKLAQRLTVVPKAIPEDKQP